MELITERLGWIAYLFHPQDPWNIISDHSRQFIWEDDAVAFYTKYQYHFAVLGVLYLPIVFTLQWFMKDKTAFKLTNLLRVWNILIAVFSIIGTVKLTPTLVHSVLNVGYFDTVCNSNCYYAKDTPWVPPEAAIWVFYFNISKLPEWIDTFFIVLRKRPLIFLHYYHHIATFLFCWYANQYSPQYHSAGFFFSTMNLAIHSFMYTYYTLCSFGLRPSWNKYLTAAQVLQMVFGVFFLLSIVNCPKVVLSIEEPDNLILVVSGLVMYVSYFILFVKLYIEKYKPRPKQNDGKSTTTTTSTTSTKPQISKPIKKD